MVNEHVFMTVVSLNKKIKPKLIMMFRNIMSDLRISVCCSEDFTIEDGNCTIEWVLDNLKHRSKI